jgi:hypothetical protein
LWHLPAGAQCRDVPGQAAAEVVKLLRSEAGQAVFAVQSGSYRFAAPRQ